MRDNLIRREGWMKGALRVSLFLGFVLACSNCSAQPEGSGLAAGGRHGAQESGEREEGSEGSRAGEMAGSSRIAVDGIAGVESSLADEGVPFIPADAKFVAPDGDDSGPGTEGEPWRNILPSFERLSPGETLVIRGGTYTATGNSSTCGNGISPFGLVGKQGSAAAWTTIMGYPGERPTLYHPYGWQILYVCDSSYVRISHLEVLGDANAGKTAPASGVYIIGSHHIEVKDVWSHDNGGCGICTSDSNHITIHGNRVWGNSHWNRFQTSGISIHRASNDGGGDNPDGYSNYITKNLIWNNYEDDSIGVGRKWGVTDGNGIIIDVNIDSGANGRTLIKDNILVDNGGPGIMITRSHAVDIIQNTLFENIRTRVPTVVNNGDIGCNRGYDLRVENNIVVPRKDNSILFRDFKCSDYSHANNVWVQTGAPIIGAGDIVLPTGTGVLSDPRLDLPAGCWTAIGRAAGHGAR